MGIDKMNMHASPANAKPIQQFKVGDFVRIHDEIVGRVIKDTDEGTTMVHIFNDANGDWGPDGNASFTGGLRLLVDGPSLDLETIIKNLGKISVALEMVEDLGKQQGESGGNNRLGDQLELIGSTYSSMASDLFGMVWTEQERQESRSSSAEN
jgi:hypothetical protein